MKVIEFIKRNISVFNVISFLLLFFIFKDYLFYNTIEDLYGLKIIFNLFVLFIILIISIIDILFKKYIKSRLSLNIFELFISLILFLIIYYTFYNS